MRMTCLVAVMLLAASSLLAGDLPKEEVDQGFVKIFNEKNLDNWVGLKGSTDSYYIEGDTLICKATGHEHIFTKKEFADFILRLQIKLEPGGNNGVGIRTKVSKVPHLEGMEAQVLDDPSPRYTKLKPYQFHGSIYGVVPAKTGHLKPTGQWNTEEIICQGSHVKVTLNGTVIVDVDLDKIERPTLDNKEHPGLKYKKGRISLHAHGNYGARVFFRNVRVKEL